MNRPDIYIKQAHAMAAWLRAQGDPEGADLADSLAEHLNVNHEAVDDQTTPDWTVGPRMDALDAEPAIRCWPEVGCVFEGEDGPVLTIDPMDGGDVSIVHMGDVVRWMSGRIDADASEQKTRAFGEAQAQLDAERAAYDATVGLGYEAGEVIDAEFEITPEEWVTLKPGEPTVGDLADPVLLGMVDGVGDAELDGEAEQAELDRAEWEPLHDDAQEDS